MLLEGTRQRREYCERKPGTVLRRDRSSAHLVGAEDGSTDPAGSADCLTAVPRQYPDSSELAAIAASYTPHNGELTCSAGSLAVTDVQVVHTAQATRGDGESDPPPHRVPVHVMRVVMWGTGTASSAPR